MNLVIISGRLGQDVETRYTGGGKAVANFTIATQSGTGDKKVTTWVPVVAWEGLAERAQQELKKGTFTTVTGRLQVRVWEDKNQNKQKTTEVVASSIGFPSEFGSSGSGQPQKPAPEQPYQATDEDLGF
jgi:single-strand DNA-binding protein